MSARKVETFADVEAALRSTVSYERVAPRASSFELGRVERLVEALGRPDAAYRVVHVAGTRGKGTTCAAVASCLDAAGLRVGLYTSPHLVDVRERIRVGPLPVPDAAWVAAAAEVLPAADRLAEPLTYFELVTAIGLCAFRAARVDVAVLEVGLGGRLDATNVVRPAVAVITRIGRDHTQLLGEDLAAIAAEKAGILKAGVPVVAGPEEPAAVDVVLARARALGAPLWLLDREVHIAVRDEVHDGRDGVVRATIATPLRTEEVQARVAGRAAARNLALAAGAVDLLLQGDVAGGGAPLAPPGPGGAETGPPRPPPPLAAGLARLRWRGRVDVLPGGRVVDGAHDEASARNLLDALRARFGAGVRFVLLFAVAQDKQVDAILDALAPATQEAVCCLSSSPRASPPAALAARLAARGVPARSVDGGVADAWPVARARATALGLPLVATGSLYLAGDVFALLGEDVRAAWAGQGSDAARPSDP